MFRSLISPRRNPSLVDNRQNASQIVMARRAVSPKIGHRNASKSPMRNQTMVTFTYMNKQHIPQARQRVNTHQPLRQVSPMKMHVQLPPPSSPKEQATIVNCAQSVPTIIKYITQSCCCHHNHCKMQRQITNKEPSLQKSEQILDRNEQVRRYSPKQQQPALQLKNDSLYTNTHNNRDEFSVVHMEEEFLSEEITRTRVPFDSKYIAKNGTLLATSADPLDECISSLQQRVEALLTGNKDKPKNRSRFLMQIVHQGARYGRREF